MGAVLALALITRGDELEDLVEAAEACHDNGDYAGALALWQKAADDGSAQAMFHIAGAYARGRGVKRDPAEAQRWLFKAADGGVAAAMTQLGVLYQEGVGVPQDYKQAMYWLRKAADKDDATAMCNVGYLYWHGQGVEKDPDAALEWFKKAASRGDALAMTNIGDFVRNRTPGKQDMAGAIPWYRKGAKHGDPRAMLLLSECYVSGLGVEKDLEISFAFLEAAADRGVPHAMIQVGRIYQDSKGDAKQALKWFERAANKGSVQGMALAGMLLMGAPGLSRDDKRSMDWLRRGAARGDDVAIYFMAVNLHHGIGAPRDVEAALKAYRRCRLDWIARLCEVDIWLCLKELGRKKEAAEHLAKVTAKNLDSHEYAVLFPMFAGKKVVFQPLLESAKRVPGMSLPAYLCGVHYYVGAYALLQGNRDSAVREFELAVGTEQQRHPAYRRAQAELERLKK